MPIRSKRSGLMDYIRTGYLIILKIKKRKQIVQKYPDDENKFEKKRYHHHIVLKL